MTEEPFESNLEKELPEPADITPPPLPDTGYETQVLVPEPEETSVEEEPAVVITAPPVPELPKEELEMPSPFEQEQPEPITIVETVESEAGDLPPAPPASPPPSGDEPKKNNTTLIIIIVVVAVILLCCCCALVILGASFWQDIAWELGLNLVQRLL